jgi:hypothetical protein
MRIFLSAQKKLGQNRRGSAPPPHLNSLKRGNGAASQCLYTFPQLRQSFFSPAVLNLHPMETMSTNLKPAGKPIFDRTAHTTPQPVSPRVKAESLDAQAEQIRKAWLERATSRSK